MGTGGFRWADLKPRLAALLLSVIFSFSERSCSNELLKLLEGPRCECGFG